MFGEKNLLQKLFLWCFCFVSNSFWWKTRFVKRKPQADICIKNLSDEKVRKFFRAFFSSLQQTFSLHNKTQSVWRGRKAQRIAFFLLTQRPRVQFSVFPRFFTKYLDVAGFFDSSALNRAWTVQKMQLTVYRTHLRLASAKVVLRKNSKHIFVQTTSTFLHKEIQIFQILIGFLVILHLGNKGSILQRTTSFSRTLCTYNDKHCWRTICLHSITEESS